MSDVKTVEFKGERFALNPDPSEFALLEFAEAASEGQDGDTAQGLASVMRLVKECIAEKDIIEAGAVVGLGRQAFITSCRRNKAGVADLMVVIQAAFGEATERPTGRPSDSSDGPAAIAPKSAPKHADSTSQFPGRPDLRLAVERMSA